MNYNSEKEMRDAKVPTFESVDDLSAYISNLILMKHDYGTCCYAMSMAATAAFNLVAKHLSVTGFQASCADLDIIRRTRSIDAPFMLVNAEKMLYPQYDLHDMLEKSIVEWKAWASEQAKEKLKEVEYAHPDVVAHWEMLAKYDEDANNG